MDKTYKIKREDLVQFCQSACEKNGFASKDARIVAEVLVDTDMTGTHSHGTKNLNMYLKKADVGGIKRDVTVQVISEGPAWALLNGDAGIGMVVAHDGMKLAIEKAKKCGIAIVCVRNSTHFGAAGYYSCMAAKEGLFGIAMGNTEPNMGIPGGKSMQIGNSPISYAFPQKCGDPLYLDIALSATAALKIVQADKDHKAIPDIWVVDKNGNPTTVAHDFFEGGALQPMAAHKGYGLSMMVEILTGLMSGGAIRHEMTSWCWDLPHSNKVSHCFIVVDIQNFMPIDSFENRLEEYTTQIQNSPCREGIDRIFVPGEIEAGRVKKNNDEGLTLPADVASSLIELAERSQLCIKWLS